MRSGPLRFILIVFAIAAVMAAVLSWQEAKPAGEQQQAKMTYDLASDMDSVRVRWHSVDGADLYVLYRADVTEAVINDGDMPKRTDYQNLGDQSTKTIYEDVNTEENHFYAYIVEAYDSAGILIGSSYDKDAVTYACVGMGTPRLINYGYGEEQENSKNRLFLYAMAEESGISPEGAKFRIFRSLEGKDQYKKIAVVSAEAGAAEFCDDTVKPGKVYSYCVQEILEVDGEKRKSLMSETVTIPAVNFTAKYRGKLLQKETNGNKVVFKLRNADKYNGKTTIFPEDGETDGLALHLSEYSMDKVKWTAIPESGLELPKEKPVYLRGLVTGAPKSFYETIRSDGVMLDYEGPGNGNTVFELNLKTKNGTAYMEWD